MVELDTPPPVVGPPPHEAPRWNDANDGFPVVVPRASRVVTGLVLVVLVALVAILVAVPVLFVVLIRHNERLPEIRIEWVRTTAPAKGSNPLLVPCAYSVDWYGPSAVECDFGAQILQDQTTPEGDGDRT